MKIGVVGAGTMGGGIAQVSAFSGCDVVVRDVSAESLQKGRAQIEKSLRKIIEKSETPDKSGLFDQTLGRISWTTDWEALGGCELIVEAVFEEFGVKAAVLQELEKICSPRTILASNTSSISITKLAGTTSRPEMIIGMHFMNPVPLMKLVEIVRGVLTSQETYERTRDLAQALGKTAVEVRDFPGFISNRILMPMINEAVFALMEGVADPESIDQVMKLGMNHPMGPLRLADLIGLDVCLDIMNVLFEGFKDSKYRPCPLLVKMVDAGLLGRKSGRGFFDYLDSK